MADLEEIAQWLLKTYPESDRLVFTQWFAANLRHPYTTPPLVSAYVPSFPGEIIERKLGARQVTDGGTLWLVVPADEGVFRETQQVGEFTLACDAQIYLDLLHVGLRGPEQAKALREWEGFGRSEGVSKFASFAEYPKRSLAGAEAALLTAWASLSRYHDNLVLVGGLAVGT